MNHESSSQGNESGGGNKSLQDQINELKTAQAVQAATFSGAQATQAATMAGMEATNAAATAGATATNAAAVGGVMSTMIAGSVALIIGIVLGHMLRK